MDARKLNGIWAQVGELIFRPLKNFEVTKWN